jgi:hypothetical protein
VLTAVEAEVVALERELEAAREPRLGEANGR